MDERTVESNTSGVPAWCPVCQDADVMQAPMPTALFIRGYTRAWTCSGSPKHLLATKGIVIEHLATEGEVATEWA